MKAALAAVALLALASSAQAAYVAANVVPTWAACPVKKPTEWDPKVFDSSLDSLTTLTEYTKDLSKACQDTLLDLAGCASDNDAFADPPSTTTSLSTSNGCCLTDCSNNIKKAISQGCFNDLLKVLCADPKANKFRTGLFNAGERCANFKPECPPATGLKANATAAVANATAAVKATVANATAAATSAVTAAASNATTAATTAVADAVKKATGGAGAAAVSGLMAVAGAAALLAL